MFLCRFPAYKCFNKWLKSIIFAHQFYHYENKIINYCVYDVRAGNCFGTGQLFGL